MITLLARITVDQDNLTSTQLDHLVLAFEDAARRTVVGVRSVTVQTDPSDPRPVQGAGFMDASVGS